MSPRRVLQVIVDADADTIHPSDPEDSTCPWGTCDFVISL